MEVRFFFVRSDRTDLRKVSLNFFSTYSQHVCAKKTKKRETIINSYKYVCITKVDIVNLDENRRSKDSKVYLLAILGNILKYIRSHNFGGLCSVAKSVEAAFSKRKEAHGE